MTTLQISFSVVVMLVVLALAFDFMNGFHDAANSIATIVSTGVLKPYQAVAWAALFNVVALFLFELKVAATIGKGIVDPTVVDHVVIFGALVGALVWKDLVVEARGREFLGAMLVFALITIVTLNFAFDLTGAGREASGEIGRAHV